MTRKEIKDFLELLQQEEQALLLCDYANLGATMDAKTAFGALLEQSEIQADDMRRIAAALKRNERLLQAARAGVEDARNSLRALIQTDNSRVYDKNGHHQTMCAQTPQLARKA